MASGCNEVEAAVDTVVFQRFSQDTRLRVQVIFKLRLHMPDDGGPATKRREGGGREGGREGGRGSTAGRLLSSRLLTNWSCPQYLRTQEYPQLSVPDEPRPPECAQWSH